MSVCVQTIKSNKIKHLSFNVFFSIFDNCCIMKLSLLQSTMKVQMGEKLLATKSNVFFLAFHFTKILFSYFWFFFFCYVWLEPWYSRFEGNLTVASSFGTFFRVLARDAENTMNFVELKEYEWCDEMITCNNIFFRHKFSDLSYRLDI